MPSKIDRAIMGEIVLPKAFGTILTSKELETGKKECNGFDIEADSITAEPFMLGWARDKSSGYICLDQWKNMLDFHTTHGNRSSINFYYNLQYDFEGMLKLFTKDVVLMIEGNSTAYLNEDQSLCYDPNNYIYRLSYIPKKAFHIKVKSEKKYSYFDLLQYYQMGLDKAAKTYLGKTQGKDNFKAEYSSKGLFELKTTIEFEIERFERYITHNPIISEKDKAKRIEEMKIFFRQFDDAKHYRETIIKYCIQDADICRKLGHILIDGIDQFINTRNYNSSATISEYYFRSNGINIPRMTQSVYKAFLKSYYGGRFENTQKGFIKNVSMYDIKSAYPYAMANMPILSNKAVIRTVKSYNEHALYGTYKINVTIPNDIYLSPLQIREGLLLFPTGNYKDYYVDKLTLETLLKLDYDIKLIEGIEIYDDNADYRLKDLILKLFKIKEDKKNQPEVVRMAAKIILNSLYGKFIQLVDDNGLELVKDMEELETVSSADLRRIETRFYKKVHTGTFKTGKLFAPFYASYITAHTRNYLYNLSLQKNLNNIVGYHTDSIMIKSGVEIDTGHELGDMEVEELKETDAEGNTIRKVPVRNANLYLLKSGMYKVEKDGLSKLRARGVGKPKDLLQDSFVVKRRMGMKQAIKKQYEHMNIISEEEIDNNLNTDMKRKWEKDISLLDVRNLEFINSRPLVLDREITEHVN